MLWRRSFLKGGAPFVPKVFKHRLCEFVLNNLGNE